MLGMARRLLEISARERRGRACALLLVTADGACRSRFPCFAQRTDRGPFSDIPQCAVSHIAVISDFGKSSSSRSRNPLEPGALQRVSQTQDTFMPSLRSIALIALVAPFSLAFGQQTVGERIDDAEITAKVKAALIEDDTAKARDVDVETRSGVVQLSGFVDTEAAKSAALDTARAVEGVTDVKSALIVRPGNRTAGAVVDDSIIASKVKAQLADDVGLGTANAVNVEVRSGIVQLSGFVDSEDQKSRAANAANTIEGVAEVRNDIEVR